MARTDCRSRYSRWYLFILVILALIINFSASQELENADSLDFNGRRIVQPVVYHERTKEEILSSRDIISGTHHSEIQVMVPVDGEQWLLDLQLNDELVAEGHTLQYQKEGKTVQWKPNKNDVDLCHYIGRVRGKPGSWVALSTCYGIRGVIFDGQTIRCIEPYQSSELKSLHYLYEYIHKDLNINYSHEDITINNTSDQHLTENNDQKNIEDRRFVRFKRNIGEQVQGPYNVSKDSRFVELVLVVDHEEFQANGGNLRTMHSQMVQLANVVNSLFSQLNIYIALVGVVVWNERDEIHIDRNSDATLVNFLRYRAKNLTFDIPNDIAYLLTKQNFDNGVVDKSLKGTICTSEFSGGVVSNYSLVLGVVAATVAHGIGHNFGMVHDTDEYCDCPHEKCIMSASIASVVPIHWSSCSLHSLALSIERGMDYCLLNKPKRLFDSPTCGNGFIEPGEQCDCGTTLGSNANQCHVCCNPNTCTFRNNATCGTGSCCDLTTCRLKSTGIVCRAADRECDLPEYCSGLSEFCPADVYKMDSLPCGVGDNQAYCVRGECRSHTDQCQKLWGSTGKSSIEKCYSLGNTKGTRNGNCGYDRKNQTYTPCSSNDVLCGLLQCQHLNDRLEFGMESVSVLSYTFIYDNGSITPCRTAIIDLGVNDVDPGLVPDGAKCGHEKMCLKQKCVSVKTVREAIKSVGTSVCPSDCSGHGICNSEGHCHCDQGFAPPLCIDPGPGGSVDSGPPTNLVHLSNNLVTNK